jgi:hypothetical protein
MIKVNTQTSIASREAIPANLLGLTSHTLSNLQTELNPVPADLVNIEYWGETSVEQSITSTQKFGSEVLTVNTSTRLVDVSHSIVDKTAEDLANDATQAQAEIDSLAANIRTDRDNLLSTTDWTASSDVTMSTAMTTYRQALRDVPAQAGFPTEVTWPLLNT